ncbi:MAG: hypothetical protein ACRC1P_11430 [Cellulosilyticaceae bacterium]
MATKKIVKIINTTSARCSFKPYGAASFVRIQPRHNGMGSGFPMEVEVLKNSLSQDRGLQAMFQRGMLILDDEKVAQELGLSEMHPLLKDYNEIKDLLAGSDDALEEYLNDIVDEDNVRYVTAMPDLICTVAREMKLSDLNKLKLIKDYTGYEIEDVVTELIKSESGKEDEKEEKPKKKSNKKKPVFEE